MFACVFSGASKLIPSGLSQTLKHAETRHCMWSTSGKILGWMKHKLESKLLGEISITSDMQMTPPLFQKMKGN